MTITFTRLAGQSIRLAAMAMLLMSAQAGAQSSGAWNNTVAAAQKEGRVLFYTALLQSTLDRISGGFRKAHPGITIEAQRGGLMGPKLDQEEATGADGADVFVSADVPWFVRRTKDGKLARLGNPSAAAWPGRFLGPGNVYAIIGMEPFVIAYNKKLVTNAPRGYADLLRPEYRGRLGTTESFATPLVAWYDWLEKTEGGDFLQRLKAQNPRLYTGAPPLAQAVASGEIAATLYGVPSSIKPLIDNGAPVEFVVPNPSLGTRYAIAALGWSKRPAAAQVFVEYLMSREGQALWHGRGETASPLQGIPGSLDISGITPWDSDAYTPETAKQGMERFNKIFK